MDNLTIDDRVDIARERLGLPLEQAREFVASHAGMSDSEYQRSTQHLAMPEDTVKTLEALRIADDATQVDASKASQILQARNAAAALLETKFNNEFTTEQLIFLNKYGYSAGGVYHSSLPPSGQKALQAVLTAKAASSDSIREMGKELGFDRGDGTRDPQLVTQKIIDFVKDKYGDNVNFQTVLDAVPKLYNVQVAPYDAAAKIADAEAKILEIQSVLFDKGGRYDGEKNFKNLIQDFGDGTFATNLRNFRDKDGKQLKLSVQTAVIQYAATLVAGSNAAQDNITKKAQASYAEKDAKIQNMILDAMIGSKDETGHMNGGKLVDKMMGTEMFTPEAFRNGRTARPPQRGQDGNLPDTNNTPGAQPRPGRGGQGVPHPEQ